MAVIIRTWRGSGTIEAGQGPGSIGTTARFPGLSSGYPDLRHCAFLTLEDRSDFCIYDHLLFAPLAARGWTVEEIPWNRDTIAWDQFSAVVIRSTWDYQQHPQRFMRTLESIDAQTLLLNPVAVCRWNLDKIYLRELAATGIVTVPTLWLSRLDVASLGTGFATFAAERLVAKPRVGANADDTFVLCANDERTWEHALRTFSTSALLLQPFVEAIEGEGEYSLFYFAGAFSHAILKRPAAGDFRVQEEHGGLISAVVPPADMQVAAARALDAVGQVLLYARVDLVRLASGEPGLIELELIEPSLYFENDPGSAERFAEAFVAMVGSER